MQHQTPQFIDIEDKVVGPLTLKQAIYIGGGLGALFLLFRFLPFFLFLVLGTLVVGLVAALAFYRFNNKPFSHMLESGFKYLVNSRLYLWRHTSDNVSSKNQSPMPPQKPAEINPAMGLGSSRLKNLSWNLEVAKEDEIAPSS